MTTQLFFQLPNCAIWVMALTSDNEESLASVNALLKRNDDSKEPNSPHPIWTSEMWLLFLVMVFWSSDNMALPAVYAEIAQTFGLTVSDLSILGLVRGIFESVCALPAGILAERLERPWLIAWGCCIWAGALGACAFAPNLRFAWAWVFWRCYIQCHDYISLHLMCVHVCAYIYFLYTRSVYIHTPSSWVWGTLSTPCSD